MEGHLWAEDEAEAIEQYNGKPYRRSRPMQPKPGPRQLVSLSRLRFCTSPRSFRFEHSHGLFA